MLSLFSLLLCRYRLRQPAPEALDQRVSQRLPSADVALLVLVHDAFVLPPGLLARERGTVTEAALKTLPVPALKLREVYRPSSPHTGGVVAGVVLCEQLAATGYYWRIEVKATLDDLVDGQLMSTALHEQRFQRVVRCVLVSHLETPVLRQRLPALPPVLQFL